jgi:hypothetical protein
MTFNKEIRYRGTLGYVLTVFTMDQLQVSQIVNILFFKLAIEENPKNKYRYSVSYWCKKHSLSKCNSSVLHVDLSKEPTSTIQEPTITIIVILFS